MNLLTYGRLQTDVFGTLQNFPSLLLLLSQLVKLCCWHHIQIKHIRKHIFTKINDIQKVTHEIHCALANHPTLFCLYSVKTFFEISLKSEYRFFSIYQNLEFEYKILRMHLTLFVMFFTRWMKTGRTGTESRCNMNSVPPLKLVLGRRTMLNVF